MLVTVGTLVVGFAVVAVALEAPWVARSASEIILSALSPKPCN